MMKTLIGDALMSFGWMFTASALGAATSAVAAALGVKAESNLIQVIFTAIIMVHIVICEGMTMALGGASFNPTANAAMYVAGVGDDTLFSMAIRFPAQVIIIFLTLFCFFLKLVLSY
ncbi:Aquaporin SIP1-1 [Bienertia sinuspersici]